MNYEIERRVSVQAGEDGPEFRAVLPKTDQPGFDGYVSTWYTVDDRGTFFLPGAFKKTSREAAKNAPVLWQHQVDSWSGAPDVPIGKHLAMQEDDRGFAVSVAVNEGVQRGAEVMSALRFGTPIGLSFGFNRIKDRSATQADLAKLDLSVAPPFVASLPIEELRAISEVRYFESSVVVFGSNGLAKPTSVRSQLDISAIDLNLLMEAIREGRLDERRSSLVADIVAAWEARKEAGAGPVHSTPNSTPEARKRLNVELESLMIGMSLGVDYESQRVA